MLRAVCRGCPTLLAFVHLAYAAADPPDTVKARLQVQGAGGTAMMYRSTLDAFAQMARREASVAGLLLGWWGWQAVLCTGLPAEGWRAGYAHSRFELCMAAAG
jgi:hypothetical protein